MEQIQDSIEQSLNQLAPLADDHLRIGLEMTNAYGGAFYGMDFLAYGALNRSKAHLAGFTQLIRSRNFVCAGALLRLQLDTALRLSAAWLVDSPHDFALAVLAGQQVRQLVDRSGKKLTDRYLVSVLGAELPWIPRVYERTSGYIHLSSVHIFSAISSVGDHAEARTFEVKISEFDKPLPTEIYIEAIDAFAESTRVLLRYVYGWTISKADPDAVAKARSERESQ